MEKQPNFFFLLSLKQIALRKVVVGLWSEPDVLAPIGKFRELIDLGNWKEEWRGTVECKVSDKISNLQLPELLKGQAIQILKPIGLQILRWKAFHEFHLSKSEYTSSGGYFDVPILEKLHWTAAATIDYRKTAEGLVHCGMFDILKRYKLACLYCLDQYVPELWEGLPQENKMYFYDKRNLCNAGQALLQFCWPYIIKGEEYKLNVLTGRSHGDSTTFRQYMFTRLSIDGNKSAAEYFLQTLSTEERETSLNKMVHHSLISKFNVFPLNFPKEKGTEVLTYLLSQMTPEQQIHIFRERPANVLGFFLFWPWQEVFLDFADAMWTWVRCEDPERRARNYNTLLDKLQDSVQDNVYCLPKFYQNFFLRCPSDFKKHFVDWERKKLCDSTFFAELFYAQDTDTINAILSDIDAEDKLRLASSKHILSCFYNSICRDEGHLVEMCLRGTGLSKEDKAGLKYALMRRLKRRDSGAIESPKWKTFFEFLDGTESTAQVKRMTDDGTLTEAKKPCSVIEGNSATK